MSDALPSIYAENIKDIQGTILLTSIFIIAMKKNMEM